jgi:osmotically-inducible protein OsmY
MNYSGRGPKGYRRSDERIRDEVCDRLTDDSRIDATDVEVVVDNGEVTLSGAVYSRGEKRKAEDVAESIPGVRDVHNNLRVGQWDDGRGGGQTIAAAASGATASGARR